MTEIVPAAVGAAYRAEGAWADDALADHVRRHVDVRPDDAAFVTIDERLSWREYERRAAALAGGLAAAGLAPGEATAALLPDGPVVHVAFLATELAGLTAVGLGSRAGKREIDHLLGKTGATTVVSLARRRDEDLRRTFADVRHVVLPHVWDDTMEVDGERISLADPGRGALDARRLGPDDLFALNSTSGTTGLPKCVMQTQNRWWYFHRLAVEAGELTTDDVFMSVIPAPFGFGLWTAHFTPTFLGAPCVLTPHFTVEEALTLIERERVSVLACVSTQFIMMLNSPSLADRDLSSLRVMFTGGEAVPYERAAAFEEATGASVLQFYGSNETGALSRTTTRDTREHRLRTAGRVIDEMHVRLFDDDGRDIVDPGLPGQPGCRGPATSPGYFDDPAANAELFTEDGWMLMGDIVEIDADGFLSVVGRKSDFIIRGGKNVSAAVVEAEVCTAPGVAMAAAVAMPDPVFGERVCVYVVARPGADITLADVTNHLERRDVSKELWPEHLVLVDELPLASGGKVAKPALRADLAQRMPAADRARGA